VELARIYLIDGKLKVMLSQKHTEEILTGILGKVEDLWQNARGDDDSKVEFSAGVSLELEVASRDRIRGLLERSTPHDSGSGEPPGDPVDDSGGEGKGEGSTSSSGKPGSGVETGSGADSEAKPRVGIGGKVTRKGGGEKSEKSEPTGPEKEAKETKEKKPKEKKRPAHKRAKDRIQRLDFS